jgi:acyl-CoA hydrolase
MHESTFTVYPDDCNYHVVGDGKTPMVHGGTMLLKMDRVAAEHVRKLLYKTDCDSALTVGVDKLTFYFGAKLGDLIHLYSHVVTFGMKRITVEVTCMVEEWGGDRKTMARGLFSFCTFKDGKSHPHGLKQ